MRLRVPGLTLVSYSVAGLALLLTTSCSKLDAIEQQTVKNQDQLEKAQDRLNRIEEKLDQASTGRFQIVVANEPGTGGAVLFLLDTRSGETSIYRPPVGGMINGFWSNIPKLTYSDEYWQRAMMQAQQPPAAAAPQPRATQPAPAPAPSAPQK